MIDTEKILYLQTKDEIIKKSNNREYEYRNPKSLF